MSIYDYNIIKQIGAYGSKTYQDIYYIDVSGRIVRDITTFSYHGGMFSDVEREEIYVDGKRVEVVDAKGNCRKFDDKGREIYRLTERKEINHPRNGQCFKKKRWFGENKYGRGGEWKDTIIEEWEQKDGKKHGFEKLYNSDGIVAEMKYWQEGKDCTAKYNKLKKIASKRIDKERAIEAETGVKTRLPKMGKGAKVVAMVKESLGLSK